MPLSIIDTIRSTLESEKETLEKNLHEPKFLEEIEKVSELLKNSDRITITGMGKSGLIAKKVASTLTSTGSSAIFLHPADALHGDIGHIAKKEMVLAFSNSGETQEIIKLLPHIKLLGGKLVAVTGNPNSTLVREADKSIVYKVEKEGCPLDLAPMASTTISLAIGDAIAASLIHMKKFKISDFSRFHPSGSLGKKLLTKVSDVIQKDADIYLKREEPFHDIIIKMVTANLGAVLVLGSKGHLRGIITDGDIKRFLGEYGDSPNLPLLESLWNKKAGELMSLNPKYVYMDALVEEALAKMREFKTYTLAVLNRQKRPVSIVRMHDLIGL